MWWEEQATVGQPALGSGCPMDTQATEEDQEWDEGDGLNSFIKPWHRVAQNVGQVNGDGLRPTLLVCEI